MIFEKYGISARADLQLARQVPLEHQPRRLRNPVYVAPYHQIDFNVSYDITPRIAVSIEGINVTKETSRLTPARRTSLGSSSRARAATMLGARYKF